VADRPLWQLSASTLAEQIASGDLSATQAVSDTVERMRTVNGDINAVVDDLGDEAIATAADHDRILKESGPIGPLHGVPITIKENVDQKGRATPNGVAAYKDIIAPDDAPLVKNLKKAGAIVIGRTNTPEFSFRMTTTNPLHGRTFNPWNDWATAGGSSGGASAAVMAGMGPIAHGNDIGGSLRFPSAATGATTVKPGLGRVPAYNPSAAAERGLLAQLMSVQGVICREVKDVRAGFKALLNYDPHDPWMVPMPFEGPAEDGPVKVAFTRNMYEFDLDPAVAKALDTARDALVDAGYEVTEIDPPLAREAARQAGHCLMGETKTFLAAEIRKHGSAELNGVFDNYFTFFDPYEGDDLLKAMAERAHYVREWTVFLQDYPLILTPLWAGPTPRYNQDTEGLDGVVSTLGSALYSGLINFLGLPAGNIAANLNDDLPVGVQIVGRRFREDQILDACEAVEQRVGVMADRLFARG